MISSSVLSLAGAVSVLASATSAGAAASADAHTQPAQVRNLLACRSEATEQARLACFEREAEGLADAVARKEVVIIDRNRARQARRSLFGLSVPDFGGLLGDEDEADRQIQAVIAATSTNANGGLILRLRDGSTWSQIDDVTVVQPPKAGATITIRRAAFGSFIIRIGNQPGFRAKRIS